MVSHTTLSFKDHITGEVKEVVFTATLLEVMDGVVGKITDTGVAFIEKQGELSIYTDPTTEQLDKFESNGVPAFRLQDIIGVHNNEYHLESNYRLPDENTDSESPDKNEINHDSESSYGDMLDEDSEKVPDSDEISDDIEHLSDYLEDHPEYHNGEK